VRKGRKKKWGKDVEIARRYLRRVYGRKAFREDGLIKSQYLEKAIKRLKRKQSKNQKLLNALILAKHSKSASTYA
jgi:hypothetical protein